MLILNGLVSGSSLSYNIVERSASRVLAMIFWPRSVSIKVLAAVPAATLLKSPSNL